MLVVGSIIIGLIDSDFGGGGTRWYYFGASREVFIALAAGGGAALLAVAWALLVYKPRRRRSHRRHLGFHLPAQRVAVPSTNGENGAAKRRQEWRRRRREHRPRNPTLAERGGLPPLRAERPSEPFQ